MLCDRAIVFLKRWIIVIGRLIIHWDRISFILDTRTYEWAEYEWAQVPHFQKLVIFKSYIVSIAARGKMKAIHMKHIIPDWRWQMIKDFVLLRKLIDDNRAYLLPKIKRLKSYIVDDTDTDKTNEVVEKLFTDISLDIFRNVMTYLI